MKPAIRLSCLALVIALAVASAQVVTDGRRTVRLESQTAALTIDLGGGSIVDFHLAGGMSPLRWLAPEDEDKPLRPMGHFLCLDRWGPPSDAELRNGMPFHGEAARVEWKQSGAPEHLAGRIVATMEATLPLAGLDVRRTVGLSESGAVFSVSETVTNRNKLGRVYNMVQHATIGPPFLDETTVVDANAQKGFMQSSPLPNPEQPEIRWPEAIKEGKPVDLRRLAADPDPNVTSFVIEGDLGWVAATNASKECSSVISSGRRTILGSISGVTFRTANPSRGGSNSEQAVFTNHSQCWSENRGFLKGLRSPTLTREKAQLGSTPPF